MSGASEIPSQRFSNLGYGKKSRENSVDFGLFQPMTPAIPD